MELEKTTIASTFLCRLLGIKSLKNQSKGQKMIFPNCRAVHTFGMKYDLTVIFLDKNGAETKRINRLRPWKVAIGPKNTTTTIEIIL